MERTAQEYESRLAQRVARYVQKSPEEADRIKRALVPPGRPMPEPGGVVASMLESAFAEEIRKVNGWPTMTQYLRGKE